MAFDFPSSPSDGQVFTPAGGPSYTYNAAGTKWLVSATTFTGQPLDALLTSIAALTFGADSYIYGTGSDTAAAGTVTSFARTVLDDTDAATARTTLGVLSSTLPWATYTPTATAGSGTFTSVTCTGLKTIIDDLVFYRINISITTNGSAASNVQVTLPSVTDAPTYTATGRENAVTGSQLQGLTAASSNQLTIHTYDNLYPGGTGRNLVISGWYREA